jgi:biopolymer transport protein TolQ
MESNQMDLMKIILGSSPVVISVLILLIFGSIISWAIIFNRTFFTKKTNENNEHFLKVYYANENLRDIFLKSEELPFSPYKAMFLEGYQELEKIKSRLGDNVYDHFRDFGFGTIERALKKGVNESQVSLNNLLSTLASIGSIAPFVGLFGTVWGIINSFRGLSSGGATLDAVAPGIAEALIATAIGLVTAIPAVWFYNKFQYENSKINLKMETFGEGFLNNVERNLKEDN